jgi:hypothetical protein
MIRVHTYPRFLESGSRQSKTVLRPFVRVRSLVPPEWEGQPIAFVNGARADLDSLAWDGDVVSLTLIPGGPLPFLAQVVLLVFFSAISYMLRPRLKLPTSRGDQSSALYDFEGVTANRTEGQPIPSYYGRIKAGGQIVNEFVESRGANGSWYNVLICYGYGPYQSIAGITSDTPPGRPLRTNAPAGFGIPDGVFINGTEAKEYSDVEMHVRLGTSEQLAIPGFDRDSVTEAIQLDLTAPEGTVVTYDPFISTTLPSTSEDPLWALHGVARDFIDRDIDAFTVKIRFQQGCFYLDSSNVLSPLFFSIAVRYIELDNSNLPITTGGPDGDGYVRLRPTPARPFDVQSDMRMDFPFVLYDPQTYTRPGQSGVLAAAGAYQFSGGGVVVESGYMTRAGASMTSYPTGWIDDTAGIDEMSAFGWVTLRPNGTSYAQSGTNVDDNDLVIPAPIISWLSETDHRGFSIQLERRTFQLTPGQTRVRITPVVRIGAGGGTVREYFPNSPTGAGGATATVLGDVPFRIHVTPFFDFSAAERHHVGFTYKRDADGANDRLRIYVDSEVVMELYGAIGLKAPRLASPTDLRICGDNRNVLTGAHLRGWLEEVFVHTKELTPQQVEDRYNAGPGLFEPDEPNCFCAYHFDENYPTGVSGNGATIVDSSPLGLNLTVVATGTAASNWSSGVTKGFVDREVVTNVPKASKYRIEVMRATRDYIGTNGQDGAQLEAIITHTEIGFTYPEAVLMALRVKAQEQLSGSAPEIASIIEGALVQVWDGEDLLNPSYATTYTRNPAWIARDFCTHPRRGMGSYITKPDIDLPSTLEWSLHNDEWVYDARGNVLDISGSGTTAPISDLGYSSNGTIATSFFVTLRSAYRGNIPGNYFVGGFVGFSGLPTGGNVQLDMNEASAGGWEIIAIDGGLVSGTARIYLKYDPVARGVNHPWLLSGSPSGSLYNVIAPTNLTGMMRGVEPRNCFDGGFDEAAQGWDTLIELCDTANAAPVRSGRKIFFRIDRPSLAIDLVTPANIEVDSFEIDYNGRNDKPNAMVVEILDEDLDYERSFVPDEHPSVSGTASLSEIRSRSMRARGITRRSQARRWMREALNQNYSLRRTGKYTASADSLYHEPGDVLQVAHDLVPRGIGGRVLAGSWYTSVILDRPVTLLAGHTYKLAVRSASAPTSQRFTTCDVTNAPGTYEGRLGQAITVSTTFGFVPQAEDVFILCESGTEMLITVRSISLTRELRREVQWVEYDPDVYIVDGSEVDDLPAATLALTLSNGIPSIEQADAIEKRLPERVDALRLVEGVVRTAAGTHVSGVHVSWPPLDRTRQIGEQVVWMRQNSSAWKVAKNVSASASSCFIESHRVVPGTIVSFAVQPITRSGSRREPEACGSASIAVYGQGPTPAAPTALNAVMQADKAVYTWITGDDRDAVSYELRRGGWVLGQTVFTAPHGATRHGPTEDFTTVSVITSPGFQQGAPLVMRARSAHGRFSPPIAVQFSPRTLDGTSLIDYPSDSFASQEWRQFGAGWKKTSGSPNATLTNLVVDSHGDLRFTGSSLTATYTTADPVVSTDSPKDDFYLSAFVQAQQIAPTTWSQAQWTWGQSDDLQFTWEGPINTIGDGLDAACTLSIEVRLLDANFLWTPWHAYKPSKVTCLLAQFRLSITRPSVDYDVRIRRFSTDVVRASLNRYERDALQVFLAQGANSNG